MKTGIVRDRQMVTMRYYFDYTEDISISQKVHLFRANGLFDPDETGIGHQPRGFDQYASFYNKYVVMSSKITVNAFSVDNSHPFILSLREQDDVGPFDANAADVIELPGNKFTLRSAFRDTRKVLKHSVNIGKFRNISRGDMPNQEDLKGTFSTDPATIVNFSVTVTPVGSSAGDDVRLVGWLDYRVMLLEPTKVVAS